MTPILQWKEPPPKLRHGARVRGHFAAAWVETLEALMHQPGRWARIAVGESNRTSSLANQINVASKLLGNDAYEAVVRSEGHGVFAVYARYAPDVVVPS